MNKKIAILAGDGIGPEIMQAAIKVLDAIADKFSHNFEYIAADIGGQAYDKHGYHCPKETLQICQTADAILFGAAGGPITEQHKAKWQNCEANSILKLRKHFSLNVNIRPISVYPELAENCPLNQNIIKQGIDLVIFRELTGGIYFGKHNQTIINKQRIAVDECRYSEEQIKSIAYAAFKAAQARGKKLCSVDKANVLATSKLWRTVIDEVSEEYKDVKITHMLVDNCAMQMVINPQQFDVIVTENMFGDIISDLAAVLPGSIGLMPSASLNKNGMGLYEPAGGSAPDIAGKGLANPCAQILSAAMMLEYSFSLHKEARLITTAIKHAFTNNFLTNDLAKDNYSAKSTSAFTDFVVAYIKDYIAESV